MELNPYSPAAAVAADLYPPQPITDGVRFDGWVHRRDVMALGKRPRGTRIAKWLFYFGLTGFAMFTLMLAALGWLASTNSTRAQYPFSIFLFSFLVFPFMVLLPMVILSRLAGRNYAANLLKISPRIVGPLAGKIDNDTIELRYPHYHSIQPIESVTGIKITEDVIGLTVDTRKLFVFVLPKHLFQADDFERVAARLAPLAIERPLASSAIFSDDSRLINGPLLDLLPIPDGGIALSGTLLRSDLTNSKLYRRQIRKFYFANLLVLAFAILLPVTLVSLFDPSEMIGLMITAVAICVPLLVIVLFRLVVYLRFRRTPDAEITKLAGSVAPGNVTLHTAIGSFAYHHDAFVKVDADDQSIQCWLGGKMGQVILLPRRFFASDADFATARSLCVNHFSAQRSLIK